MNVYTCTMSFSLTVFFVLSGFFGAIGDELHESGSAVPDGYLVEHGELRIPVFQCGLYATAVTLNNFRKDFDLPLLAGRLACEMEKGTDLLSIKEVLEAHGLLASGVKSVSVKELRKRLATGETAIIPSPKDPTHPGHFFSFLGVRDADFIVVDYPGKAKAVTNDRVRALLSGNGGIALLVGRAHANAVERGLVCANPMETDLGDVPLDGTATFAVKIINRGSCPMLVESVRVACGCMKIEIADKLWIEGSSNVVVKGSVNPRRWGAATAKSIYIDFADGGLLKVNVKARITPPQELSMSAVPNCIYLNDANPNEDATFVRKVHVTEEFGRAFVLESVSAADTWLHPEIREEMYRDSMKKAEVHLRITPPHGFGDFETSFKCKIYGVKKAITVPVRIRRKLPVKVSPSVVTIYSHGGSFAIATISVDDSYGKCQILSIENDDSSLTVEWPDESFRESCKLRVRYLGGVSGVARGPVFSRLIAHATVGGRSVQVPIVVMIRNSDQVGEER